MRLRELLREEIKPVKPELKFIFELSTHALYSDVFRPIRSLIEKIENCKDVTYSANGYIFVTFNVNSTEECSKEKIDNLFNEIQDIIVQELKKQNFGNGYGTVIGNSILHLYGVPAFPIHGDIVKIEVSLNFEFRGLEKLILSANELIFVFNTTVVIPLLSLFKMKNIKSFKLIVSAPRGKQNEMIDIVQKHLDGDKDMLDCQEELIQAGFKEYAKL